MHKWDSIFNGIETLVVTLVGQLNDLKEYLIRNDPKIANSLLQKDNFVDNLKGSIESKLFDLFKHKKINLKAEIGYLRGVQIINTNLERIGDYIVNIVKQTKYYKSDGYIDNFNYLDYFEDVLKAVKLIVSSLKNRSVEKAIEICDHEIKLDIIYGDHFKEILNRLYEKKDDPENLITSLFIFHYFERMGDAIQNIGEGILLACLGEKVKIKQLKELQESISSKIKPNFDNINIENIWGTRSGCHIGKISNENKTLDVVYKEGEKRKILEEKEKLELWAQFFPQNVPKIFEYQEFDDTSVLIAECIKGQTLKTIALNGPLKKLEAATKRLCKFLQHTWTNTIEEKDFHANYAVQLENRLEDVTKLHPEFIFNSHQIGGYYKKGFRDSLVKFSAIVDNLGSNRRMLVHGDFNLDNIIVDDHENIYFIDLHRSGFRDYIEDVAVFIVSNFRVPVFKGYIRENLNYISLEVFRFTKKFAEQLGDNTMEARLSAGLARSFITSTRFELNKKHAKNMFLRGVYLMELLEKNQNNFDNCCLEEEYFILK